MSLRPRTTSQAGSPVATLCANLAEPAAHLTLTGADPDAVVDLRAVFQTPHRQMDLAALPPALLPKKGRYGLTDYEKVFCPAVNGPDIFDLRGIDRDRGAVVLVRPDQYVADVFAYDGIDVLIDFLSRILIPARCRIRHLNRHLTQTQNGAGLLPCGHGAFVFLADRRRPFHQRRV